MVQSNIAILQGSPKDMIAMPISFYSNEVALLHLAQGVRSQRQLSDYCTQLRVFAVAQTES